MCRVELSLLFFRFHLSFFCLLFLFACVVLPHYVVNKDEYNSPSSLTRRHVYLQQKSSVTVSVALVTVE